ncbi:SH3 domain-containing protein [Nonomuraea sp. H19]|uniref:SH3 domain-containing protein n=1 Tax=Nonomuraea sp. H19 TaxID=3452206 RepID=UPI003F8AEC58
MRTSAITFVLAGAVGATGLLGLTQANAAAAQGAAVRTAPVPAQPEPEPGIDLVVADPEGAPVRSGPGPDYEILYRTRYGEKLDYDKKATDEVVRRIAEQAWVPLEKEGYVWMGDVTHS